MSAFFGSLTGNIMAVLYYTVFQIAGLIFSMRFLKNTDIRTKLLTGSVSGSVLLHWTPVIIAFACGFTKLGHGIAVALVMVFSIILLISIKRQNIWIDISGELKKYKLDIALPIIMFTYLIFAVLVLKGIRFKNGEVFSSQASYGDMSMHIGFVTSIANQNIFPPEYSILPGTRLCYPFLSDSISSSLYLVGGGIKLSYCLPMLVAGLQVMTGAYLFLEKWLKSIYKAVLGFMFFFFCGGFGFIYFSPFKGIDNFSRIFTAFYNTPTNLLEENVRWVNMVVDMLFPQRATLFGYAVLFTILGLIYDACFGKTREKSTALFIYSAFLGASLPMIHTHSFLSLALISVVWVSLWMMREMKIEISTVFIKSIIVIQTTVLFAYSLYITKTGLRESNLNLLVWMVVLALIFSAFVVLFICYLRKCGIKNIFSKWGIYLIIICIFAIPQLLIWTLNQASGDGFLRGHFNWANIDDNYLWFYFINLGLSGILFALGYLSGKKETIKIAVPVFLVWFFAELAVFQPNTYDNNKLLYVAFLFMCGLAGDFVINFAKKINNYKIKGLFISACVILCTVSGALTMCREVVSEYTLFDRNQVKAAEYIEQNTYSIDTILTDDRHNNAIAVLTGRNIVCGSGSYLYFHGLEYGEQYRAQREMFEYPEYCLDMGIFDDYSVDYILISNYERSSYNLDEDIISGLFPLVFSEGDVNIYKVN